MSDPPRKTNSQHDPDEQEDRRLKERERASRTAAATTVIPNLADQLSSEFMAVTHSPSGRVGKPPSSRAWTTTTKIVTSAQQQQQQLLDVSRMPNLDHNNDDDDDEMSFSPTVGGDSVDMTRPYRHPPGIRSRHQTQDDDNAKARVREGRLGRAVVGASPVVGAFPSDPNVVDEGLLLPPPPPLVVLPRAQKDNADLVRVSKKMVAPGALAVIDEQISSQPQQQTHDARQESGGNPPLPSEYSHGGDLVKEAPTPEGDTKTVESSPSRRRRFCGCIVASVIVLVIIISVSVGIAMANGGPAAASPPTAAPPVESERMVSIREFLVAEGISTHEQLITTTTPQYQALLWLSNVDTTISPLDDDQWASSLTQRYVLAVFYYSLNGEHWDEATPWLDPQRTVCEWGRILCAGEDVIAIREEAGINLNGTIPTELNALPLLEELSLTRNPIRGLAAPILSLRTLVLHEASLGEISQGIPSNIFEMTNLEILSLEDNGLGGTFPTDLGKLTSLTLLNLAKNSFKGTVSANLFQNMVQLEEAYLSDNQLSGNFMEVISGAISLRKFVGSNNLFTGTIGSEIEQLTNLQQLELVANGLEGSLSSFFFKLPALAVLDLSYNELTGTLGAEIAQLTKCQILALSGNQISGTLPSDIGSFSTLYKFRLQLNFLKGTIPTEIGLLHRLQDLFLENNFLTGPIPSEVGTMQSLDRLNLHFNQLAGPVPTELGQLSTLIELQISYNSLTGTLPSEVCDIPTLQTIVVESPSSEISCGSCSQCD